MERCGRRGDEEGSRKREVVCQYSLCLHRKRKRRRAAGVEPKGKRDEWMSASKRIEYTGTSATRDTKKFPVLWPYKGLREKVQWKKNSFFFSLSLSLSLHSPANQCSHPTELILSEAFFVASIFSGRDCIEAPVSMECVA